MVEGPRKSQEEEAPHPHSQRLPFWAEPLPWVGCVPHPSPPTHSHYQTTASWSDRGGQREEGLGTGRDRGGPPEQQLRETRTPHAAASRRYWHPGENCLLSRAGRRRHLSFSREDRWVTGVINVHRR